LGAPACRQAAESNRIQLEAALELIEHYERHPADRRGTVDLLVHYLEAGNDAIRAYGDLYEEYYDSMIGVAQRCVDALDAELTDEFLPRLRTVLAGAAGVGWGYEDMLFEIIGPLREGTSSPRGPSSATGSPRTAASGHRRASVA